MNLRLWRAGLGEGTVREFGIYTLLYSKWISSKDLLHSTGNSTPRYVAAWRGGGFGGERIHVCMAESLHCSPETITLLIRHWVCVCSVTQSCPTLATLRTL